jgi:hypothetical protein
MTATAVIDEIKQLPREEQSRVIRFVNELARQRQLSGEELGALAKQMVEAKDPAEASRLEEEIVRGFYGGEPDPEREAWLKLSGENLAKTWDNPDDDVFNELLAQ